MMRLRFDNELGFLPSKVDKEDNSECGTKGRNSGGTKQSSPRALKGGSRRIIPVTT
jgi:hypothetical protein